MLEAFSAMFDASWGWKKSPGTSCSALGKSFKWVSYSCPTLSFILNLCQIPFFFFFLMHWQFRDEVQDLPSFIDVQDCDKKALGWLSSCCQFDGRVAFYLPLGHSTVKMKISKSTSTLENVACIPVSFCCRRRIVPSTSHGIVRTTAAISLRCYGNPLWEAQTKLNT